MAAPPAESRSRRLRGCLVGGALGDALGAAVEFMGLDEIRARHGPAGVTGMLPAYGRTGAITDDTQMSMFTAEGLIRAGLAESREGASDMPAAVWEAYGRWLFTQGEADADPDVVGDGWLASHRYLHSRRAPGLTCLAALRGGVSGTPQRPINDSKGCGGLMRIAPVGLVAHDAFRAGCEVAALTHGHPSGFLSAGAFALMVALLSEGTSLDEAVLAAIERLAREPEHEEVLRALEEARRAAAEDPASPEAVEALGAGWVAEEALAIAAFSAGKASDFASGVLLAVNHSGDSDSTGALTGNLLGAMLGEEALPAPWVERLEGLDEIRRLADDLGRVRALSADGGPVPADLVTRYPPTGAR